MLYLCFVRVYIIRYIYYSDDSAIDNLEEVSWKTFTHVLCFNALKIDCFVINRRKRAFMMLAINEHCVKARRGRNWV